MFAIIFFIIDGFARGIRFWVITLPFFILSMLLLPPVIVVLLILRATGSVDMDSHEEVPGLEFAMGTVITLILVGGAGTWAWMNFGEFLAPIVPWVAGGIFGILVLFRMFDIAKEEKSKKVTDHQLRVNHWKKKKMEAMSAEEAEKFEEEWDARQEELSKSRRTDWMRKRMKYILNDFPELKHRERPKVALDWMIEYENLLKNDLIHSLNTADIEKLI